MPPGLAGGVCVGRHAKSWRKPRRWRTSHARGAAERITCPLLVVVGAGDRLVPPSDGESLVKTASGPTEFVVYPEGDHVCFNISYKYRPLTGDWMAERLGAAQA